MKDRSAYGPSEKGKTRIAKYSRVISEKYKLHGLTRLQDNILGSFGQLLDSDGYPVDIVWAKQFTIPGIQQAARELKTKGLLNIYTGIGGSEFYILTIMGKELWKVRAKKEKRK